MSETLSIEWVEYLADKRGALCHEVVFLGGAVVGLLITEPWPQDLRPTKSVDVTVRFTTLSEFYKFDQELTSRGFLNDMTGPVCRYLHGVVRLDVMPATPDVLGFANPWYPLALDTSADRMLGNGSTIRLISAPLFLATKLEAFSDPNREGNCDVFPSRDFADIVSVIDGRPAIVDEVSAGPEQVRRFLAERARGILSANYLEDALAENLERGRDAVVITRLAEIAAQRVGEQERIFQCHGVPRKLRPVGSNSFGATHRIFLQPFRKTGRLTCQNENTYLRWLTARRLAGLLESLSLT